MMIVKVILAVINLAMSLLVALGVAGGIIFLWEMCQQRGFILLGG